MTTRFLWACPNALACGYLFELGMPAKVPLSKPRNMAQEIRGHLESCGADAEQAIGDITRRFEWPPTEKTAEEARRDQDQELLVMAMLAKRRESVVPA